MQVGLGSEVALCGTCAGRSSRERLVPGQAQKARAHLGQRFQSRFFFFLFRF
jgi:hypothetical protein